MKNTEPSNKKEAITKKNKSDFAKKSGNGCKNKILNIVNNPRGGTLESFFQSDHHKIVIGYYFGKSKTPAKCLYYHTMGKIIMYG